MTSVWIFVPSFIQFDQIFKNLREDWTVAHNLKHLIIVYPSFAHISSSFKIK
jgi:hypothetical protein